jgi:hypothetical protein
MRFKMSSVILASTRITLKVILSGQDTRFFPERLTGAVGKGFLMVKAITNLENMCRISIPHKEIFS